jgi:hypothetical protein
MQEFFKTAVSNTTSSRYHPNHQNQNQNHNSNDDIHCHSRTDSESILWMEDSIKNHSIHTLTHHHNYNSTTHHNTSSTSTSSSLLPGTMNLFLPHHDSNKYSSGSTGKKNVNHGMSENDIKSIIYNTESFHIIQEQLRVNYRAQSNSVAKQVGIQLIREQYIRQQQLQLRKEQQARQEQRQLQIARELTEARIKSQQALKLKIKTKNESDDEDDEGSNSSRHRHHHDDDTNKKYKNTNSSNGSPTSVMSTCVSIPDDVMATNDAFIAAPLMSMNDEDDSEDGDIQEVTE